jgi:hypothetical protein
LFDSGHECSSSTRWIHVTACEKLALTSDRDSSRVCSISYPIFQEQWVESSERETYRVKADFSYRIDRVLIICFCLRVPDSNCLRSQLLQNRETLFHFGREYCDNRFRRSAFLSQGQMPSAPKIWQFTSLVSHFPVTRFCNDCHLPYSVLGTLQSDARHFVKHQRAIALDIMASSNNDHRKRPPRTASNHNLLMQHFEVWQNHMSYLLFSLMKWIWTDGLIFFEVGSICEESHL